MGFGYESGVGRRAKLVIPRLAPLEYRLRKTIGWVSGGDDTPKLKVRRV
jgi:hypothetical protein